VDRQYSKGRGRALNSIYTAIGANLLVASAKFTAAFFTGSAAMAAEGIHTLVDAGNGGLVLLGKQLAAEPADAQHPFGHGKELYFWTLIVALLVFAAGGGVSLIEGIRHMIHPHAVEHAGWNYALLGIAGAAEGYALLVAVREFEAAEGKGNLWGKIRATKDPSTFTVILEDSAATVGNIVAFLGIWLGGVLDLPILDGAASVFIGLLLTSVAVLLARESKGLLVGEGADGRVLESISRVAEKDAAVEHAGYPFTMYFGPHTALLTMNLKFRGGLSAAQIEEAVARIERQIRDAHPDIRHIYLEAGSLSASAGSMTPDTPG
jgi:cation diffusion facilitator family transporter